MYGGTLIRTRQRGDEDIILLTFIRKHLGEMGVI